MRTYILSRLVQAVPVAVAVSALVFAMFYLLPGTFIDVLLAEEGEGGSFDREQLIKDLRLDRPLYVAYGEWAWGLVRFDLGDSLITQYPITEELLRRWPVTIELTVWTLFISVVVSLPVGVLAAFKQDTVWDYLMRGTAILGLSLPNFWLAVMIITYSAIYLGWLPRQDYVSFFDNPLRNAGVMLIPALITSTSFVARTARMMRSTLLEVIREDYVRTARAKGLSERVVLVRHAGRNAMIPVVTLIGLEFLGLMSGTVIIERIFDLPGIGNFALEALQFRDFFVLQNIVFMYALLVIIGNLLTDITYAYLDPRISYAQRGGSR